MAEELSAFPETRGRRPMGESRYPFDEWFDGRIRRLDAGEDFMCKLVSIKSALAKEAKRRGIKYRTAVVNDNKSIVVQALLDK